MPEQQAKPQPLPQRDTLQTAKKGAIGALFFLILFIPRIRRLRRRVWAWTAVRLVAALVGGGLVWLYVQKQTGTRYLVCGLVVLAFASLVRARPQVKTAEEKSRELGALVVLNGGTFVPSEGVLCPDTQIFVLPERLLVLNSREEPVGEIPLLRVERYAARPLSSGVAEEGMPWALEISWESRSACFRYEGFFAEHLARVAETTLRNLLRKELPVLKA